MTSYFGSDEGHHVKNAQIADENETVSNSLGALSTYCLTHGSHIGLATATYMRGDARHILPDKMAPSTLARI